MFAAENEAESGRPTRFWVGLTLSAAGIILYGALRLFVVPAFIRQRADGTHGELYGPTAALAPYAFGLSMVLFSIGLACLVSAYAHLPRNPKPHV
jgi:hypothetical protein